jgi:uncharacterized Zn finger protein
VLYVFADQLDRDPWMLLQWLGRSKADILELFAGSQMVGKETPEVAPWWPLRVDASNNVAGTPMGASSLPVASTPVLAHAVLDRLGPLEVDGSVEAIAALRELYRLIAMSETVNESV